MYTHLRKKHDALDLEVADAFSELLKEKNEFVFLDDDAVENGEFDETQEYRNEITGNVIDIHIIKVNEFGIYVVDGEDNTKFHTIRLSDLADIRDRINLVEMMYANLKF